MKTIQMRETSGRRLRVVFPLTIIIGLMLILAVQARSSGPYTFRLVPASDTIAGCLGGATATVTVFPKEEVKGVDTFDLKAEGLFPNTAFTVFLTEGAQSVGAVQYIGDFTTNGAGRGSLRVDTIVEEAFSSTVVGTARVRKELNHVVLWFADPDADNQCFAPAVGPVTPFDGDGQAGAAVLSSRNFVESTPIR